mmetsp:Transcript_49294/g.68493  ORF Transcript_49294/g.68493 Transcript_49294/m.68493 type:complete len:85 (-) Transcript_49294:1029-1283(-)
MNQQQSTIDNHIKPVKVLSQSKYTVYQAQSQNGDLKFAMKVFPHPPSNEDEANKKLNKSYLIERQLLSLPIHPNITEVVAFRDH